VIVESQPCLGLIAGDGRLPFEIAHSARRARRRVCAVGYPGITDPALEKEVDTFDWISLGQFTKLLEAFAREHVAEAVMAGKISKELLYGDVASLRPDARALEFVSRVEDLRDDSILRAVAELLAEEGVELIPQIGLCPELVAEPGQLGQIEPSRAQCEDIAFGWPIALALGGLDIGQSVVVESLAVLAVEAIEGTDATVLRAGRLGRGGACLIKRAKPGQDLRFDLPTIGPGTLHALLEARVAALAFEAHCTIILDREELVRLADTNRIPILAIGPDGPGEFMGRSRRGG
jgi:DUF1009 family protein